MKTIAKLSLAFLVAGTIFSGCEVQSGYVVRERPVEPYYVQPTAPYADAVWIPGEWVYRGGNYVYVRGYYTHARHNRVWVAGHWNNTPRGYAWERGHWR
ncbi:YXWGXW repeat-containing protein [Mucilaginibacter sp. HMF5004]|uniref:YXWGXW repeat-containing protein n=1 Tax=Mucilaginibacter rivuli TaxID=2857527 RepID=UPI001C5CE493|nr:YXWGXW repeat-containing protein [Mucilaginibacter rivuli]MBW4889530.1 YXWGXW repeat-containing protein [Mucilaginibacter rivuli]